MIKCKDVFEKSTKIEIHIKLGDFIELAKSVIEDETKVNLDGRIEPVFDDETFKVGLHLDGDKFSEEEVYNLKGYSTMEDFSNAELSMHAYFKELVSDVNKVSIYSKDVDFGASSTCLITIDR